MVVMDSSLNIPGPSLLGSSRLMSSFVKVDFTQESPLWDALDNEWLKFVLDKVHITQYSLTYCAGSGVFQEGCRS